MNENECAYYIYYFAYQLKLANVAMANKHNELNYFLNELLMLLGLHVSGQNIL